MATKKAKKPEAPAAGAVVTLSLALQAAATATDHLTALHIELAPELREVRGWILRADPHARDQRSELPGSFCTTSTAFAYLDGQLALAASLAPDERAIVEAQRASEHAQRRLRTMPPGGGVREHAAQPAAAAEGAREARASSEFARSWPIARPRRSCRCRYGTCERCLARVRPGIARVQPPVDAAPIAPAPAPDPVAEDAVVPIKSKRARSRGVKATAHRVWALRYGADGQPAYHYLAQVVGSLDGAALPADLHAAIVEAVREIAADVGVSWPSATGPEGSRARHRNIVMAGLHALTLTELERRVEDAP